MKLTVNQTNLNKTLALVGRAVNSRSTMPVLSNILLATDGDRLKLSATNRQISIACWIDASVDKDGAITIPARTLTEYVNNLPNGEKIELDLKTKTQTLRLKCGKFSANIKGIHADDYPLLPTIDDDMAKIEFDSAMLRSIIDRVAFAASGDENRPTLTGVLCQLDVDGVTMAATDGFRLSVAKAEAGDYSVSGSYIIPASSLSEVARMVTDTDSVTMHTSIQQLIFSAEGHGEWQRCEIATELIDAKYPDYTGTIPKQAETTITVASTALLKAVTVASLFARGNSNIINLYAESDSINIHAASIEFGDSDISVPATCVGNDIGIAFNAVYLREALQNFTGDIIIELTQSTRPGLIHSGSRDAFYHVIMPMHPQRE